MSAGRIDLVIDRLVVEGIDLTRGDADELARLVEEELGRIVDAGARPRGRDVSLVQAMPDSLGERADMPALARALAERIATEAGVVT